LRIPFDLGFVFHPTASDEDNADVLRILLEALVAANIIYRRGIGSRAPSLYKSGVTYGRTKVWDSVPDLYERKYGDCKSLTAARVAELRLAGKPAQPVFRFQLNPRSKQKDFHILVRRGAVFEDPSRELGMEEWHRMNNIWCFPR
jgi:transglutaminase-like putative cysteine protease